MKDEAFKIYGHWEEEGLFYIDTDYGQLNTANKAQYDKAVKDGFIIIKMDDYPERSVHD